MSIAPKPKPGLTIDSITSHFAERGYSSREVQELRRELEALEAKLAEHAADPRAHDSPPPFRHAPQPGGAILNDRLEPERRVNPKRGERMMATDSALSFARAFPHAERIRRL